MIRRYRTRHINESSLHRNILFPGGFKPVHDGHISMISEYLSMPDTSVHVIISRKDRQGLSAGTSMDLLMRVFGGNPRFSAEISDDPSPIRTVYGITSNKVFGDGVYIMAASSKGSDMNRSISFANGFSEYGKYATPGVVSEISPVTNPIIYSSRGDDFDGSPVSSTIVRDDILQNNVEGFMSAYENAIDKGILTPDDIIEYYSRLRGEIDYPQLAEGGAAGHMNHIYDDDDVTFGDIQEMIDDLFNGRIEDITEKMDGMNIFASVDEMGRTIFARNRGHLRNEPMLLDDMMSNDRWTDTIKDAFIKGADTIENVFNNIPKKIDFFNRTDKAGRTHTRMWCNIEVINSDTINVIPYVDNMISFHTILAASNMYDDNGMYGFDIKDDPDLGYDMGVIDAAVKKTNSSVYKTQITPKVAIRQTSELRHIMDDLNDDLQDLMYEYSLNVRSTISDYKYNALKRYIHSNSRRFASMSDDAVNAICLRVSGKEKIDLRIIRGMTDSEGISHLKWLEKDGIKRVMIPLERFFVNVGNKAIRMCDNMTNRGKEAEVIQKLRDDIVKTIDKVSSGNDPDTVDRLEYLLSRLGDQTDLNASEGIVFRYRGRTYKLTGSFAALNQILGIGRYRK